MYKDALLFEYQEDQDNIIDHGVGYVPWEEVVKEFILPSKTERPLDAEYEVMCENDFKVLDLIHVWKAQTELSDNYILSKPDLDIKGLMGIFLRNMKLEELESPDGDEWNENHWGDDEENSKEC